MPTTINGWTITGLHGKGTLIHASVGTIHFGKNAIIGKLQMNRIDLTEMAHGTAEDVRRRPCRASSLRPILLTEN